MGVGLGRARRVIAKGREAGDSRIILSVDKIRDTRAIRLRLYFPLKAERGDEKSTSGAPIRTCLSGTTGGTSSIPTTSRPALRGMPKSTWCTGPNMGVRFVLEVLVFGSHLHCLFFGQFHTSLWS